MVTSLEERGKVKFFYSNLTQPELIKFLVRLFEQQKCDLYWPEDMENPLVFDDLTIDKLNAVDFENYVLRRFKVELVRIQ